MTTSLEFVNAVLEFSNKIETFAVNFPEEMEKQVKEGKITPEEAEENTQSLAKILLELTKTDKYCYSVQNLRRYIDAKKKYIAIKENELEEMKRKADAIQALKKENEEAEEMKEREARINQRFLEFQKEQNEIARKKHLQEMFLATECAMIPDEPLDIISIGQSSSEDLTIVADGDRYKRRSRSLGRTIRNVCRKLRRSISIRQHHNN